MAIAATVLDLSPEQISERDRVLTDWQAAKLTLDAAKAAEMEARKLAFPVIFGTDARPGTNRVALGGGWTVKGVRKINYTLSKDMNALNAAYAKIEALGNRGPILAALILKRVYDFGEGEYKKLSANDPNDKAVFDIVNEVLTTSDGTPTLEIESPK